jgi:hypothetical protein
VVLATGSAAAGDGVVLELPGLLVLALGSQSEAEEAGYTQCFGVILSEQLAAAGQGVAMEVPGLLIVAKRPLGNAEEEG